MNVFQIGDTIVSHLSVEECKIVCHVSRDLHEMVASSSSFCKRAKLRLTASQQSEINNKMEHLQLSSWSPASVELDTTISSKILEFMENNSRIFENIQTLRIIRSCTDETRNH